MANSAIDTNLVALAERLGADRKIDRERMTTIEQSVSSLSNTVNEKESNLQEQIDTNKSAIIAGDSTTLESAKEYSDSKLSIHDASNEAHPYIQGNVSGVDNRVGGIEGLLNGVMYEDNTIEGNDYSKIVDVDNVAGTGTVKSLGGKTLVWNQLVNRNYADKTAYGVTMSMKDGIVTVSGTSTHTSNFIFYFSDDNNKPTIIGHKYYYAVVRTDNSDITIKTHFQTWVYCTGKRVSVIKEATIVNKDGGLTLAVEVGGSYSFSYYNYLIDLTLMFGEGNEPSTVEEFEAMFDDKAYPYDEGSLISAGVQEVKSVGRNLFSGVPYGSITKTAYFHEIYNLIDLSKYPDIKSLVISYKASSDVSGWYGSLGCGNGSYASDLVNGIYPNNEGIVKMKLDLTNSIVKSCLETNGKVLALRVVRYNTQQSYTASWSNLQIEIGDTDTPYVPYKEHTAAIPMQVQNLPGYGMEITDLVNTISWDNKTYTRYVGYARFDGSETWTIYSSEGGYKFYINKSYLPGVLYTTRCRLKNNKGFFQSTYIGGAFNENAYGIHATANSLVFHTSKYTTIDEWKSALASHNLEVIYELATPIVTDISDILPSNNTLPVESGGTITFKNQHGDDYRLPVPNTLNLPVKIDQFENTLNSAKDYSDTLLTESKSFTTKTSLERAIEAHYALQRTGKLYQVKIPLYDINPTIECIKTLDNADLVCEPSTDTTEGRDDYADIPLFQWVYCNYIRDDDGTPRPTAIEGMEGFSLTGSVDVGVMQMSFFGKMEQDEEYQILTISDTPHPELGLVPWKNCVDSNGNVLPWNIYSAFQVVTADDGLLRSQPGKYPAYKLSHNNMITEFQKKGKGYWGGTADRNTFQRIFTLIKYGKKSSQAVFAGCTTYDFQHTVSIAETDVKRVIVTTSQGNSYVVGQCVSVGEPYNGTSKDRQYDILHSIADRVLVSAKENVTIDGTEYTAIYLDVPENFSTTSTSVVSSMPCYTGQTMRVKGHHDGSITSNTNGYYGYRVQGVEYAIGQYMVASDTVGYLNDALTKPSLVYVAPRGLAHSATESVIKSTYTLAGEIPVLLNSDGTNRDDYIIGDVGLIDFRYGVVYPYGVKSGSYVNGVGDYFWAGGADLNTCREWVLAGNLTARSLAGSACLRIGFRLDGGYWTCGSSD